MRSMRLLLLLVIGGCARMFELPPPAPGLAREVIEVGTTRCRGERCTYDVAVGRQDYRVEAEVRVVSPEEASGRRGPSVGRQVLSGVAGAVLRGIGVGTSRTEVGIGTRRVSGGGVTLECSIVLVDEITTEREDGEDRDTAERLADGFDCATTGRDSTDTAPRWRFRRGLAPQQDSLAVSLDSIADIAAGPAVAPATMTLVRTEGAATATYRFVLDSAPTRTIVPQHRWTVHRPDGSVVATLHRTGVPGAALDVVAGVGAEEAAVLRAIGAALAPPL